MRKQKFHAGISTMGKNSTEIIPSHSPEMFVGQKVPPVSFSILKKSPKLIEDDNVKNLPNREEEEETSPYEITQSGD